MPLDAADRPGIVAAARVDEEVGRRRPSPAAMAAAAWRQGWDTGKVKPLLPVRSAGRQRADGAGAGPGSRAGGNGMAEGGAAAAGPEH